jgi:hypothetical protein
MVVVGSIVLALMVIAVSVFIGSGWALVLLELGAAGLMVVLFLRRQSEEIDVEPGAE